MLNLDKTMSIKELMNLKGRVALVTGGAGHIGVAICDALAELGAAIVLLDLAPMACEAAATRIRETFGVDTLALAADLAKEAETRQAPKTIEDYFGRLDILVNCAALVGTSELKGWVAPFPEQASKAWRSALEINLTAPFILTQACAGMLASSGHGSVVNIGSIYGTVGPDMRLYEGTSLGNPAAYAAGKGGLLQLTRWLATVMAPEVRVNAVSSGGVGRNQPEEFCVRYAERTPLGRMATEGDLKGAVAYLAGDLSAYVTGHNLVVDGGWTAW